MNPDAGCIAAIDLGGTTMKGALVGDDGTIHYRETRPTLRGPGAAVAGLANFAAALAARAGRPAGVGVVVPGLLDEARGVVRLSENIGWRDVPLRDMLETALNLPVALGHDVRAGAIAEASLGSARGHDNVMFLPIGTGIAAAIVLEGQLYSGALSFAGELGHIEVVPGGEPCPCGRSGCLERYASAAAIGRRYAKAAGLGSATAEQVVAASAAGDRQAQQVWWQALDTLASALASSILILDPGLIVIGGGLAAAGDQLLRPLRERLDRRLGLRPPPPLEKGALGSYAACLGAAAMARGDSRRTSAG